MNLAFISTFTTEPFFTNDAIVLGILISVLAFIFATDRSENKGWKLFYKYIPTLLLCYFLPALIHWPLNLIAAHWYDSSIFDFLNEQNLTLPKENMTYSEMKRFFELNNIQGTEGFQRHSQLYYVASRFLLPASLVLLCLSIDLKGLINLGWRSVVMFLAGTVGIILGGPIALLVVKAFFPSLIPTDISLDELWRGMSTIAGSWIGGGANQTAMKEIYEVADSLFGTMVIIDVIVANIWMAFLLYGANTSDKIDQKLKADNSSIKELEAKMSAYSASVKKIPTTTDIFILLAVAFGGVAIAHWGADTIAPFMKAHKETLANMNLQSLTSKFFWMIVIVTTIGVALSFTKARKLEGVGATRFGSLFIYILVATIGMKMNISEVFSNLGLFVIGIIWMLIHVLVLLGTAKLIRAPFFFVAVGSQANVGGAASAPIVASAFNPALASVGVLMAVLGYALGTYGAIICAMLMKSAAL